MRKGLSLPKVSLGSLSWEEGADYIGQRVRYRLLTPLGSRMGYEDTFGSRLISYVHRKVPAGMISATVIEALKDEDISDVKVNVTSDDDATYVDVSYTYDNRSLTTSVEVKR